MNLSRLWTIARLELTQRVRTVAWYVLLGIFALILLGVTALAFLSYGGWGAGGPGVFSIVVYIILLLVVLVSPTLSGNSINGDRDAATLAPVQVTLATTGEILLGKFLAAWITGLAFAAVAVPFLIIATFSGDVDPVTVVISLVVLIVQTGVISAIGVALSGILARPLFSVAATYLVVMALVAGSVIGFGLVGAAISTEYTTKFRTAEYDPMTGNPECRDGSSDCGGNPDQMVCGEWQESTSRMPRYDYVWWMLAANPFVILADAVPTRYDPNGYPVDMFGWLKYSVRAAQIPQSEGVGWDECDPDYYTNGEYSGPDYEETIANTVPTWFVGLGVQVLLAAGLLWWAWARTRTPARTLPPGTRIA